MVIHFVNPRYEWGTSELIIYGYSLRAPPFAKGGVRSHIKVIKFF